MPGEHPEWPGPRDADEGATYARDDDTSDANVFVVDSVDTRDDGAVVVKGRFEKR